MAYIDGSGTKIYRIPPQSTDLTAAHPIRNSQIDYFFQWIVFEQVEQLLELVRSEDLCTLILFLLWKFDPVRGIKRDYVKF